MTGNPFTYGNPISDPDRFFGRQREVAQVFSRLRNREAESSSLVGERRVGKTSLMNYLSDLRVRKKYGVESPHYLFLYSDLQMVDAAMTPDRLIRRLMRQLAMQAVDEDVKRAADDLRQAETIDNFSLADLFDVLDLKNLQMVLLLDEFEKVTTNANFGPDFFYGLRSLAIQHNLTLVTSSRSELIELTHSEVIKSSPFFNIFANINVPLFNRAEALTLISTSLEGTQVRFSEEEIRLLLRIAGTHPFFLQAACHFLFEAYASCPGAPEREQYLLKEFREEAAPHLDDYWFNSTDSQKIVLAALALQEEKEKSSDRPVSLAQLKDLYGRSEQTLSHLEKRGLAVQVDGGYHLFNAAFGRWIIGELSSTGGELTYEEWQRSKGGVLEKLGGKARSELVEILPKISDRYRELLVTWASDPKNWIAVAGLLRTVFA
jgi:AAA+ ATPase superfamily predicted ATPase